MTPLVRTLLVWLLALALPLQGATAATMALCGPGHHTGTRALEAGPAIDLARAAPLRSHDGLHGHMHGTSQAAHEHHHQAAGAGHDQAGGDASDADLDAQSKADTCSVCAACCSLAVMASGPKALPVAEFAAAVFPPIDCSVDAFATKGPERPPRIDFA